MDLASAKVKIRHVFGATCFRRAAPPDIVKLSDYDPARDVREYLAGIMAAARNFPGARSENGDINIKGSDTSGPSVTEE